MTSFPSTVPTKLAHSANGTEYQSRQSRVTYKEPVHHSQIGTNSLLRFNSGNTGWNKSPVNTNEQRQVICTSYDGSAIKLDVNSLLKHIKDVLQVELEGESRQEALIVCYEKKTTKMIPRRSKLIHDISYEIWCECEEKGNAQERAHSLLNLLSNYSPDEKVVLVLAAFAVRYGDVMVTMNEQTNGSNNMVNSLVSLKELIGTLKDESTLKLQTDMKATVNIVLGVVYFIMELKGFHTWDIIISEIDIDEIILWMVTAVIHCGFRVSQFYSGYSLILNEKSEQVVTQKIKYYHQELTRDFDFYRRREERIQAKYNYGKLSELLEVPPASNIEILGYFISSSTEGNILYKPGTREQTTLLSFQEKNVLILYSTFATQTFQYELSLLKRFYNNTNTKFGCKIVWIPILINDQMTTINENSYMEIISKIPCCYTLTYEVVKKVNRGLVYLLRKDWGFTGKPMLVALDERGRVVRQNALLMLDLYGDDAFPFTTEHENQLLAKNFWGMQLLLPDSDAKLSQWKKSKEQYVCLYGGDDLEWCKKLDVTLQTFTEKGNIKVEKAYVGWNSHHKEKVEKKLTVFKGAMLGHCMDYSTSTEFWKRLQKFTLHFSTQDSSDVSQKFLSWAAPLLIFDESRDTDTWVAIGNADNVVIFRGSVFLSGLNIILGKFEEWKSTVTTDSFLEQLCLWLHDVNKEEGNKNHCHKLEIAGSPALIKGDMHCPTCEELMQLTMVYKCCTTEN